SHGCVPVTNPIYTMGGGDPERVRWGFAEPTTFLGPLTAQTTIESSIIGEVYDTLFRANHVLPGQIFCWMCTSYTTTIDNNGNTHLQIRLKQNLEFHDGQPVTADDVAFSLLAIRDNVDQFSAGTDQLLGVTVYSSILLDIVMQGQSISHLYNLSTIPILPQHI